MKKNEVMQQPEFEPLPVEFEGKGSQGKFYFKQLMRVGDVALYRKTKEFDSGRQHKSHEVIVVRKQKESFRGDIHYKAKEHYPNDEEFGRYAWAFISLEAAVKKFEELLKRRGLK
jgi:hypothetical protein